jgi:hypothetical protein
MSGIGSSMKDAPAPHCPSNKMASRPPRSAVRTRARNQSREGAAAAPLPDVETVRIIGTES